MTNWLEEISAPEIEYSADVLETARITGRSPKEIYDINKANEVRLEQGRAVAQAEREKAIDISQGGAVLEGLAQGATLGGYDELLAGAQSAIYDVPFSQALAQNQARLRGAREKYPFTTGASEFVGSMAVAGPTAGIGRTATTQVGKYGLPLLAGMGEGATYGFLGTDGGIVDRAKGAGLGGGIGAATAGLGMGVGRLIEGGMNAWTRRRAARNAGTTPGAAQSVSEVLGPNARGNIQAAGRDAMLADAGPEAALLLDIATKSSPSAALRARGPVGRRFDMVARRFNSILNSTLGAPVGVKQVAKEISESTKVERNAAYTAAYDSPINYASGAGDEITGVIDRVPQELMERAIREANAAMREEGTRQSRKQIKAVFDEEGNVTFSELPNVMQLDYLKRSLQTIGRETDSLGRATNEAARANRLARDLRNAVSDAVPVYSKAVELGADKIAMDNALILGRKLMKPGTTIEEVALAVDGMTAGERSRAAQGVRSYVNELLANVKKAASNRGSVDVEQVRRGLREFSSEANQAKVRLIIGDDAADRLFKSFDEAEATFQLGASIAENSRTMPRELGARQQREKYTQGVFNSLRQGKPVGAKQEAVATLLGRSQVDVDRLTDRDFANIADLLTAPDPLGKLDRLLAIGDVTAPMAAKLRDGLRYLGLGASAPASSFAPGILNQESPSQAASGLLNQ